MKTRSLTEGAMLGAITVLITIVGEYLGISPVIVAAPLIILVYRHGFKFGTLASLVAALISGLVIGDVLIGLSIIISAFAGIAMGLALREKFSFPKIMIVGVVSNLIVLGLNALLLFLVIGENILVEVSQMFINSMERAFTTVESLGMVGENAALLEEFLSSAVLLYKLGLPSIIFLSALFMTFINLALARLILKRMNDNIPWVSPFTEWRIPRYYGLFFILGLVLTSIEQKTTLPFALQLLGVNLRIIFSFIYFILGISVSWYFFNKYKVASAFKVAFIILLFLSPMIHYLVTLLAVIDAVVDFRKLELGEVSEN